MGCDIHIYREKHLDGFWLTADPWQPRDYGDREPEVPYELRAFRGRDYDLFGLLCAGVRREHPFSFKERGLPFDVTREVLQEARYWGGNGHSHSHLYLHELKAMRAFLDRETMTVEGMKDARELSALRASIDSGKPDWRLLYPYCAATSRRDALPFRFDVPASFLVGRRLAEIISSFDGIDGDLHRVVFWFDN